MPENEIVDLSGLYFPLIGLNMEIYRVYFPIQSKYKKIQTSKNSELNTFYAVIVLSPNLSFDKSLFTDFL